MRRSEMTLIVEDDCYFDGATSFTVGQRFLFEKVVKIDDEFLITAISVVGV